MGKPFSPVCLVGPAGIMTWLNQYHEHCEEILDHIKYVDPQHSRGHFICIF